MRYFFVAEMIAQISGGNKKQRRDAKDNQIFLPINFLFRHNLAPARRSGQDSIINGFNKPKRSDNAENRKKVNDIQGQPALPQGHPSAKNYTKSNYHIDNQGGENNKIKFDEEKVKFGKCIC